MTTEGGVLSVQANFVALLWTSVGAALFGSTLLFQWSLETGLPARVLGLSFLVVATTLLFTAR